MGVQLRMINNITLYVIGVLVFIGLLSCRQNEVYYEFATIPQHQWYESSEICFEVDSIQIDPSRKYNINLEISHNVQYAYKTLWLLIDHNLQDTIITRDTLECLLTDEMGKWKGSGNGPVRQISLQYKSEINLDTTKHKQICVRHAMQDFQLKGIERIGLKIY